MIDQFAWLCTEGGLLCEPVVGPLVLVTSFCAVLAYVFFAARTLQKTYRYWKTNKSLQGLTTSLDLLSKLSIVLTVVFLLVWLYNEVIVY